MENTLMAFLSTSKIQLKNILQFKVASVVLGNETCDLDSAVSSIIYGLYLDHQKIANSITIPVLNIPRLQLPVKTEVIHILKKYNLALDDIVCRDEIDLHVLHKTGCLQLTLVDHHTLPEADRSLASSVVTVLDHRPQDPAWQWPQADLTLSPVGSCCTLVAEKLFDKAPQLISPTVATLILGTILIDTACLSAAAGRATPRDHQMVERLQSYCGQPFDRQQLYDELLAAKADISALTASQLLVKDLKVTSGIPIAGLPIKVKDFLKRADASSGTKQFCEERGVELCVIYGMANISRDIAIFSLPNSKSAALQVVEALTASQDPFLNLIPQICSVDGFTLFEQLNVQASRKQLLPIIRQVGETLKS